MRKLQSSFLYCCILCLLTACYEPIEDCLDANASNFNVDADRACTDCCEFPELSISISHKAGEKFLNADSVYFSGTRQPFRVSDFKFYLSNFRLIDEEGNSFSIEDELSLTANDNGILETIDIVDDVVLVRRTTSKATLGTFRESGSFVQLQFLVGLSTEVNQTVPSSAPDDHPLREAPDSLYFGEGAGYIFQRAIIQPDTGQATLRTFEIGGTVNLVLVELAFAKSIARGTNTSISLVIDYLAWLKGIDFEASEETIRQSIVDNTPSAFSIDQ